MGAHPIRSCQVVHMCTLYNANGQKHVSVPCLRRQYDFEEDLRHAIHTLVRGSSYSHIDTDLSK